MVSLWPDGDSVMSIATREHSMIAVEASSVDAMMLFRNVWTARTPFFDGS